MRSFLRFTLKQTVLLNLFFILLMVVGVYSVLVMPVERYPNVDFGKVIISTYFPGASPQDVETLVTREIEDAIEDLENVEFVQSTSYRERSTVQVKFVDDTDYQDLFDELRFKVLSIMDLLPEAAEEPVFTYIDVNEWLPVVSVNLVGDRSNRALTLMAETLEIPLSQIQGVDNVKIQGEYVREFHILLGPGKLSAYGVTYEEAARAIQQANVTIPAGDFTTDGGEFAITVDEKFRTRQQVLDTIVRRDADGSFVRLADLAADAYLTYRDPFVISSVNGRDAVTLKVIKTPQGNALDIKKAVERVVEEYRPILEKEGVSVVMTQDSTIQIKDSVRTLGLNLTLGIILVFFLIWAFMGLRNAGLTTIGIPFAFLFTMVIMYITGNSLNEISLFSFVLVSGIVVDDAIVVVENIFRHLQEGEKIGDAVVNGTAEVFAPVMAATCTTIAAFLPMLIMTGSTGEFFAIIPKAVTFALAASLIECLIILPLHFKDFGPREPKHAIQDHVPEKEFFLMAWFRVVAVKALSATLRFRFLSLAALFAAFAFALFIAYVSFTGKMPLIKVKFFPEDYAYYYIEVRMPTGTPIEETSAVLKEISEFVAADGPGKASSAAAYAGFRMTVDYQEMFGGNLGFVVVTLPTTRERDFAPETHNDPVLHLEWMRERLARYEGRGFDIRVRPESGGPPTGKDVNIRVIGSNEASVAGLAAEMTDFLRTDPRTADALIDLADDQGQPSRVFRFDVLKDRAAEYGLGTSEVAALAASVLDGRYIGTFRLSDEDVDIKLKMDPGAFDGPAGALKVPVMEHPAGPVRLGDLAKTRAYMDPGYLNRFRGERAITLSADIRPGSPLSPPAVVRMAKQRYAEIAPDYPGASLDFAGEFEDTRRSYASLGYAFIIAVMLIYGILAVQFSSYLQPMIIMSAVIFALIGVVFGTFVSRTVFTVNSLVAIVGVTGVVVNDSLMLIEFINKRYRAGLSRREAVWDGVRVRLRPILLTTLTTTLGLLPMAVGVPEYSIVWGTMARTFVTGLCTATFLTIIIVPVEWDLLEALKEKVGRSGRGKAEESGGPGA